MKNEIQTKKIKSRHEKNEVRTKMAAKEALPFLASLSPRTPSSISLPSLHLPTSSSLLH